MPKLLRSVRNKDLACPVLLANLLLITLLGPTIAVNSTLYFFVDSEDGMSRREGAISVLMFVLTDLFLALALVAVRDRTKMFEGCSTKVTPLPVTPGSTLVPISLAFKWILTNNEESLSLFILQVSALTLLAIAQLAPLLYGEYKFVKRVLWANKELPDYQLGSGGARTTTTLMFSGLKLLIFSFMLLDVLFLQPSSSYTWQLSAAPIALDYPLLISVLNFLFLFFSHRQVHLAYDVHQSKCTAITTEYVCCDGTSCSSVFREKQLLAYDPISLHSTTVDVEYQVEREHELPEWLRAQLFENIYSNPV